MVKKTSYFYLLFNQFLFYYPAIKIGLGFFSFFHRKNIPNCVAANILPLFPIQNIKPPCLRFDRIQRMFGIFLYFVAFKFLM